MPASVTSRCLVVVLSCDNAHNFNRMKTSGHEWWYDAAETFVVVRNM